MRWWSCKFPTFSRPHARPCDTNRRDGYWRSMNHLSLICVDTLCDRLTRDADRQQVPRPTQLPSGRAGLKTYVCLGTLNNTDPTQSIHFNISEVHPLSCFAQCWPPQAGTTELTSMLYSSLTLKPCSTALSLRELQI